MSFPGFCAALIALAIGVLIVVTCVHERERFLSQCAPHIHSVPVTKWHGGNAPKVRMPKGCS